MVLTLINQLIYMLGQLLVINSLKLVSRDRFTSMEILQKSKDNELITPEDYKSIKEYYDFKITDVGSLNFDLFIEQIRPPYSSIYQMVKRLDPKFSLKSLKY